MVFSRDCNFSWTTTEPMRSALAMACQKTMQKCEGQESWIGRGWETLEKTKITGKNVKNLSVMVSYFCIYILVYFLGNDSTRMRGFVIFA